MRVDRPSSTMAQYFTFMLATAGMALSVVFTIHVADHGAFPFITATIGGVTREMGPNMPGAECAMGHDTYVPTKLGCGRPESSGSPTDDWTCDGRAVALPLASSYTVGEAVGACAKACKAAPGTKVLQLSEPAVGLTTTALDAFKADLHEKQDGADCSSGTPPTPTSGPVSNNTKKCAEAFNDMFRGACSLENQQRVVGSMPKSSTYITVGSLTPTYKSTVTTDMISDTPGVANPMKFVPAGATPACEGIVEYVFQSQTEQVKVMDYKDSQFVTLQTKGGTATPNGVLGREIFGKGMISLTTSNFNSGDGLSDNSQIGGHCLKDQGVWSIRTRTNQDDKAPLYILDGTPGQIPNGYAYDNGADGQVHGKSVSWCNMPIGTAGDVYATEKKVSDLFVASAAKDAEGRPTACGGGIPRAPKTESEALLLQTFYELNGDTYQFYTDSTASAVLTKAYLPAEISQDVVNTVCTVDNQFVGDHTIGELLEENPTLKWQTTNPGAGANGEITLAGSNLLMRRVSKFAMFGKNTAVRLHTFDAMTDKCGNTWATARDGVVTGDAADVAVYFSINTDVFTGAVQSKIFDHGSLVKAALTDTTSLTGVNAANKAGLEGHISSGTRMTLAGCDADQSAAYERGTALETFQFQDGQFRKSDPISTQIFHCHSKMTPEAKRAKEKAANTAIHDGIKGFPQFADAEVSCECLNTITPTLIQTSYLFAESPQTLNENADKRSYAYGMQCRVDTTQTVYGFNDRRQAAITGYSDDPNKAAILGDFVGLQLHSNARTDTASNEAADLSMVVYKPWSSGDSRCATWAASDEYKYDAGDGDNVKNNKNRKVVTASAPSAGIRSAHSSGKHRVMSTFAPSGGVDFSYALGEFKLHTEYATDSTAPAQWKTTAAGLKFPTYAEYAASLYTYKITFTRDKDKAVQKTTPLRWTSTAKEIADAVNTALGCPANSAPTEDGHCPAVSQAPRYERYVLAGQPDNGAPLVDGVHIDTGSASVKITVRLRSQAATPNGQYGTENLKTDLYTGLKITMQPNAPAAGATGTAAEKCSIPFGINTGKTAFARVSSPGISTDTSNFGLAAWNLASGDGSNEMMLMHTELGVRSSEVTRPGRSTTDWRATSRMLGNTIGDTATPKFSAYLQCSASYGVANYKTTVGGTITAMQTISTLGADSAEQCKIGQFAIDKSANSVTELVNRGVPATDDHPFKFAKATLHYYPSKDEIDRAALVVQKLSKMATLEDEVFRDPLPERRDANQVCQPTTHMREMPPQYATPKANAAFSILRCAHNREVAKLLVDKTLIGVAEINDVEDGGLPPNVGKTVDDFLEPKDRCTDYGTSVPPTSLCAPPGEIGDKNGDCNNRVFLVPGPTKLDDAGVRMMPIAFKPFNTNSVEVKATDAKADTWVALPREHWCDGTAQCAGGVDEADCDTYHCKLSSGNVIHYKRNQRINGVAYANACTDDGNLFENGLPDHVPGAFDMDEVAEANFARMNTGFTFKRQGRCVRGSGGATSDAVQYGSDGYFYDESQLGGLSHGIFKLGTKPSCLTASDTLRGAIESYVYDLERAVCYKNAPFLEAGYARQPDSVVQPLEYETTDNHPCATGTSINPMTPVCAKAQDLLFYDSPDKFEHWIKQCANLGLNDNYFFDALHFVDEAGNNACCSDGEVGYTSMAFCDGTNVARRDDKCVYKGTNDGCKVIVGSAGVACVPVGGGVALTTAATATAPVNRARRNEPAGSIDAESAAVIHAARVGKTKSPHPAAKTHSVPQCALENQVILAEASEFDVVLMATAWMMVALSLMHLLLAMGDQPRSVTVAAISVFQSSAFFMMAVILSVKVAELTDLDTAPECWFGKDAPVDTSGGVTLYTACMAIAWTAFIGAAYVAITAVPDAARKLGMASKDGTIPYYSLL